MKTHPAFNIQLFSERCTSARGIINDGLSLMSSDGGSYNEGSGKIVGQLDEPLKTLSSLAADEKKDVKSKKLHKK